MVFRQLFSVLARSCATRSILQADGIPIITFIKQYLHSFLHRVHFLHLSLPKALEKVLVRGITPVTETLRK